MIHNQKFQSTVNHEVTSPTLIQGQTGHSPKKQQQIILQELNEEFKE